MYLCTENGKRSIIKVYRKDFPTKLLSAQLDLIDKINATEFLAAGTISSREKSIIEINFPEGKREAVHFTFAEGERIRVPKDQSASVLGRSLATFHEAGKNHVQSFQVTVDFKTIYSEAENILSSRIDLKKLLELLLKIEGHVSEFESDVIAHGDIQPENFHFQNDKVIFFDLDFSGRSSTLFDIASFYWYDHQSRTKDVMNKLYEGYSSVRPLSEKEINAIPYFSLMKAVHHMIRVASFFDGIQSPLWKSSEMEAFVVKLEKWYYEKCGK